MNFVVFDIETGPLPMAKLKEIMPGFDRASVKHPGSFDPASVKCGNIGGPTSEKGLAKIADAHKEHSDKVAGYDQLLAGGEANHWLEIESRAALSAITGRVLSIGYRAVNDDLTVSSFIDCINGPDGTTARTEADLLKLFWIRYESNRKADRNLVGFNSREFDVPFMAQRSVILNVPVPKTLIQNERYLCKTFVDLRDRWSFGAKPSGGLDLICKACGLDGKPDGVKGSHFADLFHNSETRAQAIDYHLNDLKITFDLAELIL